MCQMINDSCKHKKNTSTFPPHVHMHAKYSDTEKVFNCYYIFNNSCEAFSAIAIIILYVIAVVMASKALIAGSFVNYML